MSWSPRLAAILRMQASEGEQLSLWLSRAAAMACSPSMSAQGCRSWRVPRRMQVATKSVLVSQAWWGGDQFGGGVVGEAGGVADQRARQGVGVIGRSPR